MVLLFCHHYHLLSPLYGSCLLLPLSVESSISTDTEIDGAAANGGRLPTHSGHGTLVRLYPQDDTLLSVWLIWCHITYQVYLCQARVKGRSSTNEHSWFFADHAFKNRMT